MSYLTELLSSTHKKSNFDCGQQLLDNYLHRQASQDVKRHLSACFIIADGNDNVKGYYTLSNASIDKELIPDNIKDKLPKSYNDIPVTLLGRLARDKNSKGERLGETLLLDALKRSYDTSITIGSMAVIVDPIDEDAKNFYLKYGFIELPNSKKMFMSMKTISTLF
ncbi:MAG: GNAT family N-acetyltransferase [Flavobacteriaceae bacterium]|nr:GNAT family N-acetyltransferase [Flavobacteriaceae bacterium]